MTIGFDAKRLFANFTGLGNYSRALVKNLATFYPDNNFLLYSSKYRAKKETDEFVKNPYQLVQAKTIFKSYWRTFSIINQLKVDKVDLFHGLSNELPLTIQKTKIKSIVTIHDLIFKVYPKTYPLIDREIYDYKFRKSCELSDRIIAISQNTKNDLIKYYSIDPKKIDVIYQACNPIYYNIDVTDLSSDLRKTYQVPFEFMLMVGSIEERKNLRCVIEAMFRLKPENRLPLVVIGKGKKYKIEMINLIKKYNLINDVIFINGLTSNLEVQQFYKMAKLVLYPSLYEGFGLPVVEALLSKVPVITSNISCLPEAGGPSSIFIDPLNYDDMANAISNVLNNSDLRNTMIKNGYDYAFTQFNSEITTKNIMNCYLKTLNT